MKKCYLLFLLFVFAFARAQNDELTMTTDRTPASTGIAVVRLGFKKDLS